MKWINAFDKEQTLINTDNITFIGHFDNDDNEGFYIEFVGKEYKEYKQIEYDTKLQRDIAYRSIMEQLEVNKYGERN